MALPVGMLLSVGSKFLGGSKGIGTGITKGVSAISTAIAQKGERDHQVRTTLVSNSWKDEAILVCVIAYVALHFYPPAVPHLVAGTEALGNAPQWIQDFIKFCFYASFGAALTGKGVKGAHNLKARKEFKSDQVQ